MRMFALMAFLPRAIKSAASGWAPVPQSIIRRSPLAVVTSAGRDYAEQTLTGLGVRPLFSVLVTAGDVTVGKPDPQGYRAAAAGLGVAPGACVVFEDAPAGVAAAKAAGMYCVAVTTTHPPGELSAADSVVSALTQVHWPLPS